MPKGGHARSGPAKTPGSRSSEREGYTLTALPNEGYAGEVPELTNFMPSPTERESEIWANLWTTPQACAWSQESWRWPIVADLAMFRARADDPGSPVGLATAVRQLRDDLGLSKAGLAANGWAIAPNEVGQKAAENAEGEHPKRERRLRDVSADAQ
jgi:hypothetical protein